MRVACWLLLLTGCVWPVDVGHQTAPLCTVGHDETCNADSSQSSVAGTCVSSGSTLECRCSSGYAADSTGHCALSACTAGVASSCDDGALDAGARGAAGQCAQNGAAFECTCADGFVKNPATGRCRLAPCGTDTIRVLFAVDFNPGGKDGNCAAIDRFKWATDVPGKKMFIDGWIFTSTPPGASGIDSPAVAAALGGTPNSIQLYDDGTHGDRLAGDGVWSLALDLPRSTDSKKLRLGYKYTWGLGGEGWTGTEEWPGNSRFLEVVDDNGDGFVYRRDVFGDEATNKNFSNMYSNGPGTLGWTTDLHGCGTPESHETAFDNASCACAPVPTPSWLTCAP